VARGKEAAQAARRKYEAAIDHIDRLSETTAEAKLKARIYEADSHRLPGVEAELKRLRELQALTTSDKLEKIKADYEKRLADGEDRFVRMSVLLRELILQSNDKEELSLKPSEWGELRDLVGPLAEWFDGHELWGGTREARRMTSQGKNRVKKNLAGNTVRELQEAKKSPSQGNILRRSQVREIYKNNKSVELTDNPTPEDIAAVRAWLAIIDQQIEERHDQVCRSDQEGTVYQQGHVRGG
jgi:hypothetical protein